MLSMWPTWTCAGYQGTAAVPLHVSVIGIPEGKEREKGREKIFEELMDKSPVNAKRINVKR